MLAVLFVSLLLGGQDAPSMPDAEPREAAPAEAAARGPNTSATPNGTQPVCRREIVTGSNRTRKICTHPEVTEHLRQQSERWLENVVDRRGTLECEADNSCGPGSGPPAHGPR
jgi:hypothetical protein